MNHPLGNITREEHQRKLDAFRIAFEAERDRMNERHRLELAAIRVLIGTLRGDVEELQRDEEQLAATTRQRLDALEGRALLARLRAFRDLCIRTVFR